MISLMICLQKKGSSFLHHHVEMEKRLMPIAKRKQLMDVELLNYRSNFFGFWDLSMICSLLAATNMTFAMPHVEHQISSPLLPNATMTSRAVWTINVPISHIFCLWSREPKHTVHVRRWGISTTRQFSCWEGHTIKNPKTAIVDATTPKSKPNLSQNVDYSLKMF